MSPPTCEVSRKWLSVGEFCMQRRKKVNFVESRVLLERKYTRHDSKKIISIEKQEENIKL
jgi:hypothetical protein